jgi:hypothetical protein
MVFALGVVLLELLWGKPLSYLKTAEDLNGQGKEDSMTELSLLYLGWWTRFGLASFQIMHELSLGA